MTRKLRTRFFLAVEGEGEQSFIKWLQNLSDETELSVHLDCQLLHGGGYEAMLHQAVRHRRYNEKRIGKAKSDILLVDGDRKIQDDGWSLAKFREESLKLKFFPCIQKPNQEGLLLRMLPGKECLQPNPARAYAQLCSFWPQYQKPVDARTLASKFSLNDLYRVALIDSDLKSLLSIIGLYR